MPYKDITPPPGGKISIANGRLKAVKYQIRKELAEHRGEGSKYLFKTTYAEELIAGQ